jgi:hypothetical protein
MIFVTVAPNVPFKDGKTFLQPAIFPAWQQGGVKVANEGPYTFAGAPGYFAQFSRTRNGVEEMGQTCTFVVNGTGIIFQMSLPMSQGNKLNGTFEQIAQTFKVGLK